MKAHPRVAASLAGAGIVIAALVGFAAPTAEPAEIAEVVVTNLPEIQKVAGTVSIDRPIPGTSLSQLSALVAPVAPTETTSLVLAGTLNATGYAEVALSLRGEVQTALHREGTIGVLLIPDQEPILRAFLEVGELQFPLEAKAEARRGRQGYFASPRPERLVLGFPRYRIYFYNTTDKSAEVDLYAYLSN